MSTACSAVADPTMELFFDENKIDTIDDKTGKYKAYLGLTNLSEVGQDPVYEYNVSDLSNKLLGYKFTTANQ